MTAAAVAATEEDEDADVAAVAVVLDVLEVLALHLLLAVDACCSGCLAGGSVGSLTSMALAGSGLASDCSPMTASSPASGALLSADVFRPRSRDQKAHVAPAAGADSVGGSAGAGVADASPAGIAAAVGSVSASGGASLISTSSDSFAAVVAFEGSPCLSVAAASDDTDGWAGVEVQKNGNQVIPDPAGVVGPGAVEMSPGGGSAGLPGSSVGI